LPTRIAARFQAAHGGDGDSTIDANLPILRQLPALTTFCIAGSFQRKGSEDREGVV